MNLPPPPESSPQPPNPSDEDTGQHQVLKRDLTSSVRYLTLQNIAVFLGIVGLVFGAMSKVGGWWVGDAVAADLRFLDHERRIAKVENGQAHIEKLVIRSIVEDRARDDFHRTGFRSPVLDEPLPTPALQPDGGP